MGKILLTQTADWPTNSDFLNIQISYLKRKVSAVPFLSPHNHDRRSTARSMIEWPPIEVPQNSEMIVHYGIFSLMIVHCTLQRSKLYDNCTQFCHHLL